MKGIHFIAYILVTFARGLFAENLRGSFFFLREFSHTASLVEIRFFFNCCFFGKGNQTFSSGKKCMFGPSIYSINFSEGVHP